MSKTVVMMMIKGEGGGWVGWEWEWEESFFIAWKPWKGLMARFGCETAIVVKSHARRAQLALPGGGWARRASLILCRCVENHSLTQATHAPTQRRARTT